MSNISPRTQGGKFKTRLSLDKSKKKLPEAKMGQIKIIFTIQNYILVENI